MELLLRPDVLNHHSVYFDDWWWYPVCSSLRGLWTDILNTQNFVCFAKNSVSSANKDNIGGSLSIRRFWGKREINWKPNEIYIFPLTFQQRSYPRHAEFFFVYLISDGSQQSRNSEAPRRFIKPWTRLVFSIHPGYFENWPLETGYPQATSASRLCRTVHCKEDKCMMRHLSNNRWF